MDAGNLLQIAHVALYHLDELEDDSADAGLYLQKRKELNTLLEPFYFVVVSSRHGRHCLAPIYRHLTHEYLQSIGAML